jgi:hypothetical protein
MSKITLVSVIEDCHCSTADFSFRYDAAFIQKSKAFLKPSWDIEGEVNKQISAMASATMKQAETLMLVAENVKTYQGQSRELEVDKKPKK